MITLQMIPAAALWIVVAVRLAGLGFGWRFGFLPGLFVVALGATLNIDQVYVHVDGLMGGHNHLNLLVHLLMGTGMTELSRLILQATGRAGKNNRHIKVLMAVGIVMGIIQTALLVPSDTPGSATNFTDTFAALPLIALYQASFFVWIGIVLGYTGWECLRRDSTGESRSFRIGFYIVGAGCMSGVTGVMIKMLLIGMEISGVQAPFWLYLAYRAFMALALFGFAVGFTVSTYARIKTSYSGRRQRVADLHALRPIVRRLVATGEGERAASAAKVDLRAHSSAVQLYRWYILIGDIRVLDAELLSCSETEIYDEIGERLERNGTTARHAAAISSAG